MENADWLNLLLTSGLLGTLVTLYAKWRHDKKKAPLEREAVLATASQQNVTDALAISAEARATAQAIREQTTADAERARERHRQEMDELRGRLDSLEDSNRQLVRQVKKLEKDDRLSQNRIGKLETNLTAAKDTVVHLMQYIRDHTTPTGSIPEVDYTIFDI